MFEPAKVHMGTVMEGKEAATFLQLRNSGDQIVHIARVETSCGCTVAKPEQNSLPPGAFTRLKVQVDTFAKQAGVKKWIRVTDHEGRITTAWLTLDVRPNPHLKGASRSLFDAPCASCHALPAKGKRSGESIYTAVCAMCHGQEAQGAYAPALTGWKDGEVLSEIISHGTGTRHMPGFSEEVGGPLSTEQIRTLRQWLISLDETEHEGYKSVP
ncbi:MAG: DUF1573 domain-containing protein [Mariprofundaceae bacterium]